MTSCPEHKSSGVGADIYGADRLALAKLVVPTLDEASLTWYLDAGTLLGAYRTGTQIAHDDDFDLAAYVSVFHDDDLAALRLKIAESLPEPYEVRIVSSYARKLEIYDAASAIFALPPQYGGADFHTVTVDVQFMTDGSDGVVYLHDMLGDVRVPREAIVPTGAIELEGYSFVSPCDIVCFLEAQYGYIGSDALFDQHTKKYIKA